MAERTRTARTDPTPYLSEREPILDALYAFTRPESVAQGENRPARLLLFLFHVHLDVRQHVLARLLALLALLGALLHHLVILVRLARLVAAVAGLGTCRTDEVGK